MSKQQSGRASTIFAVPRRWAGLIAVIGLTGLFGGCKGEEAAREDVVRPVKVAIVEAAPQGRTLSYAGVVRPRIESALGFPSKAIRVEARQRLVRARASVDMLAE